MQIFGIVFKKYFCVTLFTVRGVGVSSQGLPSSKCQNSFKK
jgi:hypothetical protein